MQPPNIAKHAFLLVVAATALVYFYGLGRIPFVGADEPRYAEVAREMYARGDLVTPTLEGRAWFEKPALVYWAEAAGFKLLGVSEFSARLGTALAGWLTVLLVGWLCGRVERAARDDAGADDEAGADGEARGLRFACAGVAASSAGLVVFSRAVNFDVPLTATVTLSLACFFAADLERDAARRRLLLAGFYAGAGASLLAKGLVGVVITCGVAALYKILRRWAREDVRRDLLSLTWGVPLALAVAAVWYVPVTLAHGRAFLREFFVEHHFARFVSNSFHHPQPFYFYLLILPTLLLPWTPFLFAALKRFWGDARRARFDFSGDMRAASTQDATLRLRLFALAWIAVPLVFFSLAQSKLPGYILPALPAACVLAGDELRRFVRGTGARWMMRATGVVLLFAAAAALIYAESARLVTTRAALGVALPLALAGAWALVAKGSRARVACAVVAAALLSAALAAGFAQGGVARRKSVRELLSLAAARGYADAPVLELYRVEHTAQFYAAGRLLVDGRGEPVVLEGVNLVERAADARGASVLVLVPVGEAYQLARLGEARAELIGDNGSRALFAVRPEMK
ncbi:MAG: glycosyltransferase family 39 protein [Acidobacteria bacterium]|nr:glycosyltransferase family 39 protein [Acidobacteriota bacterium]